jgi:Ca-activated chloride channel family protein
VAVGSPAVVPKTPDVPQSPPPVASPRAAADSAPVEIGIVYGTEKTTWLQWANKEFAKSDEGRNIRVTLIPMGSMEGAHAVLDGDTRIDVWSPASGIYKESFLRDWDAKYHGGNPIVREDLLAITPMVIVMWKNRYDIFIRRSPEVSLRTIGYAMHTVGGWRGIGGNAEWGDFKFGHTYPNQSNSGLAMLLLLAYEFHAKHSGLTVDDIMSQKLQDYLAWFGQRSFGQSHSTGDLMKEMVLKGPSSYDALMVYESVAIDYLRQAEGRWDQLQIIYPKYNLWNDNPYYVLKTPWSTPARQEAAETFLRFLMSEPIQLRALDHGFRPGNPAVPVQGPKSPFTRYAASGLRIDIPTVCETPPADVIENVQQSWARNVRSH